MIVPGGGLAINVPTHALTWKGREIELTMTEFKLLALLTARCGRVRARNQLLHEIWGYSEFTGTRTADHTSGACG